MKDSKKRRIFSHQEAEALLPEIGKRLKDLQNKKEAYSRAHDALFMHELVCAAEKSNGFAEDQDDLEAGIHALEDAIEELAMDVEEIFKIGCILRNIDKGLIEFLGTHDGQQIFFSWKMGETNIRYYRPIQGRAGQRLEFSTEAL